MSTVTEGLNVLPTAVNVSERGKILSGHFEVSLTVTRLCWMQQCALSGRSVCTWSVHYSTEV